MLEKDDVKRILSVMLNGMQQAPRFLAGTVDVFEAEQQDLVDAVRASPDTACDDEHAQTIASTTK